MTNRLCHRIVAIVLAVGLWMPAGAQDGGVHPLSGRRYALPMSVAGADWLDRREREQEEATDQALRLIQVRRGSVVADVGAGSGYFVVRLAALVGPEGRVYANDIQPGMLDLIRGRIARAGLRNVEVVLGTPSDPALPDNAIDLVLMVDVYHEFSQPQAMLRQVREALRPGGRLVLLEYRAEDPRVPIRPEHKMTVAQAKLEVEAEGFTLAEVNDGLPWQHLLVFTRR
jgi:ubiquinone/menaquinone biosynthesis C-methylase UbiE